MEEEKKILIECECGTHLLQVTSDVEYFDDKQASTKRVRQEFWLAMFTYGTYHIKPRFFEKLKIAWNYFKTGKMHEDQIILHPDEAQKLVNFINDNLVPTEKQ